MNNLEGGRFIAGDYHAVWHTNTQDPPQTWEHCVIKQTGSKIKYTCLGNKHGFDYEFIGEIKGDIIIGRWKSKLQHENVSGGATLFCTPRGDIFGFWVGDCKKNNFTWGYWGISKDKSSLDKLVTNMQDEIRFNSSDILHLFE